MECAMPHTDSPNGHKLHCLVNEGDSDAHGPILPTSKGLEIKIQKAQWVYIRMFCIDTPGVPESSDAGAIHCLWMDSGPIQAAFVKHEY